MNASIHSKVNPFGRIVRVTAATAAIAAVALGASSLAAHASTPNVKSHDAQIGSGATRLVARVNRGLNAKTDRYSTYATTNSATIDAIIKRVDALPKALSSGEMCPMDVGATLTLSFYRHSSTPYAIVVADPGGCGPVSVREYNVNDSLQSSAAVGGGNAFSTYVATQLHISSLQVF
jgi:hypothetical protein